MSATTREELLARIKVLSEQIWEQRCAGPEVEAWLSNFDGSHLQDQDAESLHALHLLAHITYFGLTELRILLRAMYRNLYRYPIIQEIRNQLGGSRDEDQINVAFNSELTATRFLGMGNPSESGTHLLYYFRQENWLHRDLFANQHELVDTSWTDPDSRLKPPNLRRLVFIDDLCGSGTQAIHYSRSLLRDIREVAKRDGTDLTCSYLVLFGTDTGLNRVKAESDFDIVDSVFEIDDSYNSYSEEARIFKNPPLGVTQERSRALAQGYGSSLLPTWPLGYASQALLLAFHHNVPDNTLPIVWYSRPTHPWVAAFPRQPKIG